MDEQEKRNLLYQLELVGDMFGIREMQAMQAFPELQRQRGISQADYGDMSIHARQEIMAQNRRRMAFAEQRLKDWFASEDRFPERVSVPTTRPRLTPESIRTIGIEEIRTI